MIKHTSEFDVVVVGAGPAGLAAACAAAESCDRVALVDETPWLGGQIWRGQSGNAMGAPESNGHPSSITTAPRKSQAARLLARFRDSGTTVFARTTVIAGPEPGLLMAEHDGAPLQIGWRRLILATGARELFLPFPGWTLPGILGPGGLQAMVKNGWPVQDQRVLLAGSGPLLLAVAEGLRRHQARIVGIVEQTPLSKVLGFGFGLWRHPGKVAQALRLKFGLPGVPCHYSAWPVRAEGREQVRRVTFTNGIKTWQEECDYLACGFGLVPNVELPLALGCELTDGFVRVDAMQTTTAQNVFCAGEPTGIGGVDCALVEGQIAGYAATGQVERAERLFAARTSWHQFRTALAKAYALRSELKSLAKDDTVVCRCEDVTLGQMRKYSGWRDAKLQSRCGMGACQGRTCGAAAKVVLGWGMESVRPPVLPACVQSLVSEKLCTQDPKAPQPLPAAEQSGLNEPAPR